MTAQMQLFTEEPQADTAPEAQQCGVFKLVDGPWLVLHPKMAAEYESEEQARAEYDWLCRSIVLGTLRVGARFESFYGRKPYRVTHKGGGLVHVIGDDSERTFFCSCAYGVPLD